MTLHSAKTQAFQNKKVKKKKNYEQENYGFMQFISYK